MFWFPSFGRWRNDFVQKLMLFQLSWEECIRFSNELYNGKGHRYLLPHGGNHILIDVFLQELWRKHWSDDVMMRAKTQPGSRTPSDVFIIEVGQVCILCTKFAISVKNSIKDYRRGLVGQKGHLWSNQLWKWPRWHPGGLGQIIEITENGWECLYLMHKVSHKC